MSVVAGLPATDVISASGEKISIVTIGHASLLFLFQAHYIYFDPWSKVGDYSKLPKADVIFVTHAHFDHLDTDAVAAVRDKNTVVVSNPEAGAKLRGSIILKNGESRDVRPYLKVTAVPAYNTPQKSKFHPKGRDNGYLLTLGGTTIYVSGDTEPQPEILALKADVIFLPVNQPYTMTTRQAADTAKAIGPKVFYPYHYSDTNVDELKALLASEAPAIDVRLPPQKRSK
jgi:L-ascorbate metabolism protein UlaG (beta-lactamase superfamily)